LDSASTATTADRIEPLKKQVNQLEESVRVLENRNLQLQQQALGDRLAPYLTKDEATKIFLPRDEAQQQYEPRPQPLK
jgi:hypothetical protein